MSLWAIADIHASRRDPETGRLSKPMDIFGEQWSDHVSRLAKHWVGAVQPDDTVVVAGDIDWAVYLEDAEETLALLESLPGKKILLRGNHDYWWSSKTTSRVAKALPSSLRLLHNNAIQADGFNICGTKGSPVPGAFDWSEQDAKLLNRETIRLRMSLNARDRALPTVVALHFPPFYRLAGDSAYRELIEGANVACVVYGHLHGGLGNSSPSGLYGGTRYTLVAGDAVGFRPVLVGARGKLAEAE
ncbi:MAG: metallophosphoesterase [Chloroflexota bacterium]